MSRAEPFLLPLTIQFETCRTMTQAWAASRLSHAPKTTLKTTTNCSDSICLALEHCRRIPALLHASFPVVRWLPPPGYNQSLTNTKDDNKALLRLQGETQRDSIDGICWSIESIREAMRRSTSASPC